jgi:hypothetical protein
MLHSLDASHKIFVPAAVPGRSGPGPHGRQYHGRRVLRTFADASRGQHAASGAAPVRLVRTEWTACPPPFVNHPALTNRIHLVRSSGWTANFFLGSVSRRSDRIDFVGQYARRVGGAFGGNRVPFLSKNLNRLA